MLALIAAIPWYAGMPIANILWKTFELFIGGLQAFIFALLTVLYFAMASGGHGDHEEHDKHAENKEKTPELAT
jgi:F-type H+-transporting ATPase subunit a